MNSLADLALEIVSMIDTPRSIKEDICRFQRGIYEAIEQHDEDAAHALTLRHIGRVQEGIGQTTFKAVDIALVTGTLQGLDPVAPEDADPHDFFDLAEQTAFDATVREKECSG